MRSFIWLCLFLLFPMPSLSISLDYLQNKLIAQGFDPSYVNSLFQRPEVQFLPQIMPKKLLHNEYKLDYAKFLAPPRIRRAQQFLQYRVSFLNYLEQKYGVSKEILVAIFLIETDLGRFVGRYRTFNVLASMALSENWEDVKNFLPSNLSIEEEKRLRRYMRRRAQWAFGELCSLLRLSQAQGFDPLAIKGSIFGAFGLPQFVPSSVLLYGIDGNGDGKIDLFNEEDALASMANYLFLHGWRNNLSYKEKIKVIETYNHSRPYAETVLKVAQRLQCPFLNKK